MVPHIEQGTYPATLHHVLFGHNGLQPQIVLQVVEEQEMKCLYVSMKDLSLLYVRVRLLILVVTLKYLLLRKQ